MLNKKSVDETILVALLLVLFGKENQPRTTAGDAENKWITLSNGSRVELDENGNIVKGMGGKHGGENVKEAAKQEAAASTATLKTVFKDEVGEHAANLLPQKWGSKPASDFTSQKEAFEHDSAQREKLLELFDDYDKHSVGVKDVPLSELSTYQSTVVKGEVEKIAKDFNLDKYSEGDKATVFKLPDGTYLLKDGNHRVNAALSNGVKSLPFNVYELRK